MNGWMGKEHGKHTHIQCLNITQPLKKWNNTTCSKIDGTRGDYTKSVRQRQILYEVTYMWNLKKWYKWTYWQNRNMLTDIENKFMVTKEENEGWGIN